MTFESAFAWEDSNSAGGLRMVCSCGERAYHGTVRDGDVVVCPKCGARYRCVWRGMEIVRMGD